MWYLAVHQNRAIAGGMGISDIRRFERVCDRGNFENFQNLDSINEMQAQIVTAKA